MSTPSRSQTPTHSTIRCSESTPARGVQRSSRVLLESSAPAVESAAPGNKVSHAVPTRTVHGFEPVGSLQLQVGQTLPVAPLKSGAACSDPLSLQRRLLRRAELGASGQTPAALLPSTRTVVQAKEGPIHTLSAPANQVQFPRVPTVPSGPGWGAAYHHLSPCWLEARGGGKPHFQTSTVAGEKIQTGI